MKAPARFELGIYRFIVNALIHCATRFGNHCGKELEKVYEIMLDFVYFDLKYVQIWRCPITHT